MTDIIEQLRQLRRLFVLGTNNLGWISRRAFAQGQVMRVLSTYSPARILEWVETADHRIGARRPAAVMARYNLLARRLYCVAEPKIGCRE